MTKRNLPPNAAADQRAPAKLTATIEGDLYDYIEPSVVCAAQHALEIFDEHGRLHSIECDGQVIWQHDPANSRESLRKLEKLATGTCKR
jgi:hypothetical protein